MSVFAMFIFTLTFNVYILVLFVQFKNINFKSGYNIVTSNIV